MKKLFLLLTALVVAVGTLAAQNRTVSGTVTSAENGEPLVGATVMGVGTTVGTTTDMDGAFTLSLPEQVTKVSVSYVGMKTQEFTITPGKMNIVLEGDNKLDEVIGASGFFRLVSGCFMRKVLSLCHETRSTTAGHSSGCADRQL